MASVLIVDDAELFREALKAAFAQEGFEVVGVAADSMAAIDLARELEPDLVMLDLLMPGMRGEEVLDAVHQLRPDLPVVVVTAEANIQTAVQCIKRGATDYIVKPLQPAQAPMGVLNEKRPGVASR